MREIKTFLVTSTSERAQEFRKQLIHHPEFQFVGFCYVKENPNYEELVKVSKPHITIVESDCGLDPLDIEKINRTKFPSINTVLFMNERNFDLLQKAYQAGVPLVLSSPVNWEDASQQIFETIHKSSNIPGSSSGVQSANDGPKALTLSFISAKDGEGKTTIALNLAASLAANYKKKVILLDLSSALSEVAMMLNKPAPGSYLNVLNLMVRDFQFDTVRDVMIDYFEDGRLLVLSGPTSLRLPEIKSFEIDLLIRLLQKNCDYLLIDAPVMFSNPLKAALNRSDWHVMITQNHLGSLRNAKLYLAELAKLDFPAHLIKIILNRVSSNVGLSSADMRRFIDPYPVVSGISSDGATVLTALNEGAPFVCTKKDAEISKCIDSLAKQLINAGESSKHFNLHQAVTDFMGGS